MRMFKKVLAGFVAAAMVATMAGCGSSNSSTKDSGSDKAAAEATTETEKPLFMRYLCINVGIKYKYPTIDHYYLRL